MTYDIEILPLALSDLRKIRDRRILGLIHERIEALRIDAQFQGDPLGRELLGFRSVRAVGQRYRIIYTIVEKRVVVAVFAVGIRREGSKGDIYRAATARRKKSNKD